MACSVVLIACYNIVTYTRKHLVLPLSNTRMLLYEATTLLMHLIGTLC